MKWSKYTVSIPNHPDENHHTLFSTLTSTIVQVPNAFYHSIKVGTCIPDRPDAQMLRRASILLDDDIDENLLYRFWSYRNRYQNSFLTLPIVMTLACNCACKYCYEVGVRQGTSGERMTNNVSDKILRWIKRYVELCGTRRLDLWFHGGEPLLNLDQIERIGLEVKRMCHKKKIDSLFSITTNGTLLTPINVEHLLNAGVELAMITLDGPQPIHDERRPFSTGEGTFDIVLKHIKQAVDKLKIHVEIYLDRHNCESAEKLANILVENGLQEKLDGLFIGHVLPTRPPTEHGRLYAVPLDEFTGYAVSLNKIFAKMGFKNQKLAPMCHSCMMNREQFFILDPHGDIYRCLFAVGLDEKFKVGNVDDDLNVLAIKSSQFTENKPCNHESNCQDCTFLPMCNCGCRYESYIRYGDMTRVVCMLDYFRTWVPHVVKEILHGAVSTSAATRKR